MYLVAPGVVVSRVRDLDPIGVTARRQRPAVAEPAVEAPATGGRSAGGSQQPPDGAEVKARGSGIADIDRHDLAGRHAEGVAVDLRHGADAGGYRSVAAN